MVLVLAACGTGIEPATPSRLASSVMVSPDHARQGDSITLAGVNWQPGVRVALAFERAGQGGEPVSLGMTTVDDQGQLSFVTIVPQAATPGVWNITATAADSTQSAATPFTVAAPNVAASETIAPEATVAISTDTPVPTNTPVPPTDPPAPTNTDVPATETPASTATPQPTSPPPAPTATVAPPPTDAKPPWLGGNLRGNTLAVIGGRFAAGSKVRISVSKDKDGRAPVRLGEVTVNRDGKFDFSARLPRQARDFSYVVAEDRDRRVIAYIEKSKDD